MLEFVGVKSNDKRIPEYRVNLVAEVSVARVVASTGVKDRATQSIIASSATRARKYGQL